MPIYEFKCGHCGHIYELLKRQSDGPPKTCPKCGWFQLQDLQISRPAIVRVN